MGRTSGRGVNESLGYSSSYNRTTWHAVCKRPVNIVWAPVAVCSTTHRYYFMHKVRVDGRCGITGGIGTRKRNRETQFLGRGAHILRQSKSSLKCSASLRSPSHATLLSKDAPISLVLLVSTPTLLQVQPPKLPKPRSPSNQFQAARLPRLKTPPRDQKGHRKGRQTPELSSLNMCQLAKG